MLQVKLIQESVHINVRLNSTGRYYLSVHENGIRLSKQFWPSTFIDLTSTDFSITKNVWHDLSITVAGDQITVSVDGMVRIDYTDDQVPLQDGTIALETVPDQDALVLFDDMKVVGELPPPQISSFGVQHRVYEDGRNFNRLSFQIRDGFGECVREDLLTSVKLFDPNNKTLSLSTRNFIAHDIGMWSSYNASTGQWVYDGVVHDESYYSYKIKTAQLIEGKYRLVVVYNGSKSEYTYNFNKLVKLPVIKKSLIKPTLDSKGNFFCTWTVPKSLFYLTDENPSIALSAGAIIDIYQNDQYIAYIETTMPAHMDQVFFPAVVVDKIKTLGGNKYRFRVKLRTNDNNNRTYSDYIDLNL